MKQIVAFAHLAPGTEIVEEREALDSPGIELRLCGPCKTPEQLLDAIQDADVAMCMKEPYTREVLANVPQLNIYCPSASNFWMRWFHVSATYTFPALSRATSHGSTNCPAALPYSPTLSSTSPCGVICHTRWLNVSAT